MRKQLIIDSLQYRLLAANIIYLLVFCFAFAEVMIGPLVLDLHEVPSLSAETGIVADVFHYLDGRLLPAALILLTFVCLHSLMMSHRIAGPLYRFRKVLEAAEQGDFSQVSIRRNDYLKKEVQSVNRMFKAMDGKNATIRERSEEALGLLPRLQAAASRVADEEIREIVDKLEDKIEALRSCTESLKLHAVARKDPAGEPREKQKSPEAALRNIP